MNKLKLFLVTLVMAIIVSNCAMSLDNKVKIKYCLYDDAIVTITIWTNLGQHIKTLVQEQFRSQGPHYTIWDGTQNNGDVATGDYIFKIEAVINGASFIREDNVHYIK